MASSSKVFSTTSLKKYLQSKHAELHATLPVFPSASGRKSDGTLNSKDSKILAVLGTSKKQHSTQRKTNEEELFWDIIDPRAIKYHYLIGEIIFLDSELPSFVERIGFERFMEKILPQYKLPDCTYMAEEVIPNIRNRIKSVMKASLLQATAVSITSDIWTPQRNDWGFLSLTVPFI